MNQWMRDLNGYCAAQSTPASQLLYELDRETHLKTLAPQMSSGPLQGQMLRFLSLMQRPKAILEIGTFTGYAAICMAEGLAEGGKLHTIEVNPELEYIIRKYVKRAGFDDRIELYIGDAKELIPTMDQMFDLVFIDAGKRDYHFFYDLIIDRVNPGGLILVDNVLWSGKVLDKSKDIDTNILQDFNQMVLADQRVENVLLPLRDGLLIIRKL